MDKADQIIKFDTVKWVTVDAWTSDLDLLTRVRILLQLTSGARVACVLPFKDVLALKGMVEALQKELCFLEKHTPKASVAKSTCRHLGFKVTESA